MSIYDSLPYTDRGAGFWVTIYADDGTPLHHARPASISTVETRNGIGSFKVVMTGDAIGDAGYYEPNRTRLILIERVDGNRVIDDFVGRIERRVTQRKRVDYGHENPGEIYSVEIHGPSIDVLLSERVVAYPSGGAYADKSGAADDLMRAYVRENMGSLALDTARRLPTASFAVEEDTSLGAAAAAEASGEDLLDVLESCAAVSEDQGIPLYFGLVREGSYDNPLRLVFRVRPYAWAVDRGRDSPFPLVLSYANARLENPVLTESWEGVSNVIYTASAGSEDAAEPSAHLGAGYDAGVLTRSERVVNGSRAKTADQLAALVAIELARKAPRIKLVADIVTEGPSAQGNQYGWDWVSGTRVVAEFEDYRANAIVGTVSITANEERPLSIDASIVSERVVT